MDAASTETKVVRRVWLASFLRGSGASAIKEAKTVHETSRIVGVFHSTRQLVKQSASQNLSELVAPERPDRKGPAPLVAIGPFGGCAVIAAGLRDKRTPPFQIDATA